MEHSIKILQNEIEQLQDLIKNSMKVYGKYAPGLDILIGEHLSAIKILKREGKKDSSEPHTKALPLHGVTVPKGAFCNLYKKECMGKFCSVTPEPDKCYHLRLQNAR